MPQVAVQVVMPLSGIVQTAAFFNAAIENLVKQGQISEAEWEAAKQTNSRDFKFNA
jgi:hypothetical protein